MSAVAPMILPAPVLEPAAPVTKWEREYQAFRSLLPQLLATCPGQYVAVHGRQVVANGADKIAVALQAFSHVGNVPIHVGLVTDEPEVVNRSGVRRVLAKAGDAS